MPLVPPCISRLQELRPVALPLVAMVPMRLALPPATTSSTLNSPSPSDPALTPVSHDPRLRPGVFCVLFADAGDGGPCFLEHVGRQAHVAQGRGIGLSRIAEGVVEGLLQALELVAVAALVEQDPGEGDDRVARLGIGVAARQVGTQIDAAQGLSCFFGGGFGVAATCVLQGCRL